MCKKCVKNNCEIAKYPMKRQWTIINAWLFAIL